MTSDTVWELGGSANDLFEMLKERGKKTTIICPRLAMTLKMEIGTESYSLACDTSPSFCLPLFAPPEILASCCLTSSFEGRIFTVVHPSTISLQISNPYFQRRARKTACKNLRPSRSQMCRNTAFFVWVKIELCAACFVKEVGLVHFSFPFGCGLRWT